MGYESEASPLIAICSASEQSHFVVKGYNAQKVFIRNHNPDIVTCIGPGEVAYISTLHPMDFEEGPFITWFSVSDSDTSSREDTFLIVKDSTASSDAGIRIAHCTPQEYSDIQLLQTAVSEVRGLRPFTHVVTFALANANTPITPYAQHLGLRIQAWMLSGLSWDHTEQAASAS